MGKEIKLNDLLGPLTAITVIAAILLVVGGFLTAQTFDELARKREQTLISNGISGKIVEVYRSLVPQVVWDEALDELQSRDAEWANNNVGQFLYETSGFAYSFVLDHENRLFFAAKDGVNRSTDIYQPFARPMHNAITLVRAKEWARIKGKESAASLKNPIQAHNIVKIDGAVYIVVASLVQPDFGTVKQRYDRAPVVVAAAPIDPKFLSNFGQRYLQPDMQLRQVQMDDISGLAQVDINDDRGQYVATITWSPGKPGTMLIKKLILPVLGVIALFFAVMIAFYRRSWRAAQALIASEARASHLAYHDPLTGLPNRVLFFDRLGVALDQVRRNGAPVAIHCLDLDRFKEVNDTFGHQMGDELICAAARRIADVCRRSDTFARLSGDEFAIVQLDATPRAAARLAERIVEAMQQPMELSGGRVHVSCSLGVNLVSEGKVSAAEAHRHADLALYRAKHNGRAQYCFFEPEMDAAMRMRREIELDLREALEQGGLYMVYQPQVDRHNNIVGVEALLRWTHPERGEVSPAVFIQIAEECGLINEIGMFTLREAFMTSHLWDELKVAINISASQLRMPDFHDKVCALLEECHANPEDFELEITEGLLLGDDPVTHDTLRKLRETGFSIALDDFGTGYSSLSYLQRYPIDKIKIDRSFISNLGVESESLAVVQAIVKLARALKLHVIAEGVETQEQRDYLVGVGCEEIQGFLYSAPIQSKDVSQLYSGQQELPAQRG
ncbi:MAG: EAL domain-containing protein [Sphingobium sp.]|nr:EAL domain-containing protein [Sphingobium sp.]MCP5400166.1 EAL domain-containing protein [Sphingomonas sp.]